MTALLKTFPTGLGLSATSEQKIIAVRGDKSPKGGLRRSQQVCDHAMEHRPRLQQSGRTRRCPSRAERTVSNILAPGLHLRLPSRLLGSGCSGSSSRFLYEIA